MKNNFLAHESQVFYSRQLETPLGAMIALSDDESLFLLEFADRRGLDGEIERFQGKNKATIVFRSSKVIDSIEAELKAYFDGTLSEFKTPLRPVGSPFQESVWAELVRIPYGETRSYAAQASAIGKASAFRAVANANGANPISLVIPCHRIINSNGKLGGYGGGLARKKWLLEHEQRFARG